MIIVALLNVIYMALNLLLIIELPSLPAEASGYLDTMFSYLEGATGILANYTPLSYLLVLFGVILTIDAGLILYKFVMWIIKKIPMLGMS